jgi:uncharacterized protein (DUF1501 family)
MQRKRDAAGEAGYPKSELGRRLRDVATLIHADVGLEIAALDCGGWDTHIAQGASEGRLAKLLKDYGESLAAFTRDLGRRMEDVCVVSVTEFGRTVRENGNRGTDHGHGSAMLVLGGRVRGRRVLSERWKDLSESNLYEGRDLPVTTDYRQVLAEVLQGHLGIGRAAGIFPGYQGTAGGTLKLFRS